MAVDVAGPAVGSAATLLAGVAGLLVGALVTARREHGKWLREERFRAYVELLAAVEALTATLMFVVAPPGESVQDAYARRRADQADQSAAAARLRTALAAVDVVGPPDLAVVARALVAENDPANRSAFVAAAREVLRSGSS